MICELTELEVTSCAHCRGTAEPPPVARSLGPWFSAAYAGRCEDCGDRFEAGAQIRADGDGGYLAQCCAGEASTWCM